MQLSNLRNKQEMHMAHIHNSYISIPGSLLKADHVIYNVYVDMTAAWRSPELGWAEKISGWNFKWNISQAKHNLNKTY